MIELPRDPLDFRIDRLTPAGLKALAWCAVKGPNIPVPELIELGMMDGPVLLWDGWYAREKIACGLYQHHKQIYEARAARDQALKDARSNSPLWQIRGSF